MARASLPISKMDMVDGPPHKIGGVVAVGTSVGSAVKVGVRATEGTGEAVPSVAGSGVILADVHPIMFTAKTKRIIIRLALKRGWEMRSTDMKFIQAKQLLCIQNENTA